jgi:pilus assembly protein CpaB
MKRRLLIIVLALILAVVGTTGVLAYIKKANARALAGMKPVSVLVAQRKIASGTSPTVALHDGSLASENLPASSVPANAMSSVPAALSPLVLSAALQPGQLLLRQMLVAPATLTSGLAIPPGLMAVTIDFCLPEVVAGALHPGSYVAVFDTISSAQVSGQPGCSGAHVQVSGSTQTRMVLTKVLVLSVGTSSPGATGAPATTTLSGSSSSSSSGTGTVVTVAVSQANAERLIQLTEAGMPYLALLSPTSRTIADVGNLLDIRPKPTRKPKPVLRLPTVTPSPTVPTAIPSPSPTKKRQK